VPIVIKYPDGDSASAVATWSMSTNCCTTCRRRFVSAKLSPVHAVAGDAWCTGTLWITHTPVGCHLANMKVEEIHPNAEGSAR